MNRLPQSLFVGLALAVVAGVGTPAAASAQDAPPVVAYRQQLMQGFRLHQGAIRAVLGGAAPAGHVEHHAIALRELATMLANAFPEGSADASSRALPGIWENRMDFMNKVSAIQSATAAIVTAAQSGDSDAVNAAVQALGGTCQGCHQTYRGPAR